MNNKIEIEYGGKKLIAEINKYGKQSDGSAFVRFGDAVVLATVCYEKEPEEDVDFLPLIVDYRANTYAAGKFPGGFFKREGKPTDAEILASRLIDRSLRPLFPKGYFNDTQVICSVYSADPEYNPDIFGLNACSLALYFSPIPFEEPVASVRISYNKGKFIINPNYGEIRDGELNLVVSGTYKGINMVEAGALDVPDEVVIEGLKIAFEEIKQISLKYKQYFEEFGIKKMEVKPIIVPEEINNHLRDRILIRLKDALFTPGKLASKNAVELLYNEVIEEVPEEDIEKRKLIKLAFQNIKYDLVREIIIDEGRRLDQRGYDEIRKIECEVNMLPRTHGSAIFTRGETQALVTVTLGTPEDVQIIDVLEGETSKRFMLHYNFPPFSVNEVSPLRAPSRREIGHGALAERALNAVIPSEEEFPYTIRIVSDILESNGSSSMATVCGGSLALMDAGVPVKSAVAGIAMGLFIKNDKYAILTDIAGEEDHSGDMDFKIAGTNKGITALQMDIKVPGITLEIMTEAIKKARVAIMQVLEIMNKTISSPRSSISPFAPKLFVKKVPIEKIAAIIGPGGKVIKNIIEVTGTKIDIQNNGKVYISSTDEEAIKKAWLMIEQIIFEVEIGRTYRGKVKRIENYGAFVEINPGTIGLLHISEFSKDRIRDLREELKEGDEILVKVIDVDENKIKLSHKDFYQPRLRKSRYISR